MGLRRLLLAFLPALLVCASCAVPAETTAFQTSDQASPNRVWIGPEYWANRLQDWRLHDGELQCVEASPRLPLRTLMMLTQEVVTGDGDLFLQVHTGPIAAATKEADDSEQASGWSGFLIGAGGDHVDYRLSAQVHHRPATDGGLLVTTDTRGNIRVFDNGVPASAGGAWSVGGALKHGELPLLAESEPKPIEVDAQSRVRLMAYVEVAESKAQLTITTMVPNSYQLLASLVIEDLPLHQVDGLIGLVSHLAPEGSEMGFAFTDFSSNGTLLRHKPERSFGPVLATQYTAAEGVLKLSAQMGPLGEHDNQQAELWIQEEGKEWTKRAVAQLERPESMFLFRVTDWDQQRSANYDVRYQLRDGDQDRWHAWPGHIPSEPDSTQQEVVVASLNCVKHYVGNLQWNGNSIWFPHDETARHVAAQNPDLLFFAGDQLYEGDLDPVDARNLEKLQLDYLYKWSRWCWSFRELTANRPTITIPDDHDVYQGNLWGAGGRRAQADKSRGLTAQDSGGYVHPAPFVNMVHRTQTAHLPDAPDPEPCEQGISVYSTTFRYAGIDFAVVADRQWKDSASDVVPDGQVKNGWFQAPDFDPRDADVPGAQLLGPRQEAMLATWSKRRDDSTWTKVLLSQTPFVNVATIPDKAAGGGVLPSLPIPEPGEYPEGYRFAADTDSGGWPQTPRNRAVSYLRDANALHLAGDQHLGSLVQYGMESPRDGTFVFTAPAVANTWPRRWWPAIPGANPEPGAPHYTGDFRDGFGNLMTVWAVANPVQSGLEPTALYDRMPGYGIVRFQRQAKTVVLECWPRWVDPTADDASQYPGWPFQLIF